MQNSYPGNKHKLRMINTVDTVEALNEANTNGQITLVRKIQRNPELYSPRLLLRNYQTGQYECVPERTFYTLRRFDYPETEWELIQSFEEYHGKHRPNPDWAAYVLPVSPAVGERFYIRMSSKKSSFRVSGITVSVRVMERGVERHRYRD